MDFRILGPFEVRREGQPLPLSGAKQQALLAILLLHANEIVSSDRLVEELWSRPPETARAALQVYIAQLRKLLEPGRARGDPDQRLLTRAPGYLLQVERDQLDSRKFERLLAEARAARARSAAEAAPWLREALSLWRGPALADFVYEPFAQGEIARLEELRIAAIEDRLDADLALGAHAELVGELEALVREHPLRERLRGQLMLALYRSGRQAEALGAYQEAHRTLDENLGIAPSPALQRLQQEILRQDPLLEGPAEPPPEPRFDAASLARKTSRTVTVLVAGRAALPGMEAEALHRLDERHREEASAAIERHGGKVESALGDRIVGAFGIAGVHEDDALRAARASIEVLDRTSGGGEAANGLTEPAAGRVGVATGEIVTVEAGSAGSPLAGEPVTLAAELEAAATAGEILLDRRTRELLGNAARAESIQGEGQMPWRLLELIPPPPPLARPPEGRIIGREGELAQLRHALDHAARESTVHLFTILGSAGIGKSRLAEEFAMRVADDATVVAGRCVPYGEGITFWPLREVVGRLTAAAPIPQLLEGEDDAALVAARVTEAIGHLEATSSLEEIFWAFRRLFETFARERPLVLVFEDVHWAEPTLLDFVDYLAEHGRAAPIVLLCLARPELLEGRPGWGGGKRNVSSLLLERLSDGESEQLIDTLASGLPKRTRSSVLDAAEGNPLFLEQILAMLAEGAAPEGEVPIPPTIQAVLAARLDRLGPGERAVIECAAVVGKEFREDPVADLLPADARRFATRHLDALIRKELLQPARSPLRGQVAFRFRHVLIQQAAYRTIPIPVRATLHERVAAWLEGSTGQGAAEHAESAGYHLEQSYRYRAGLHSPTDEDRDLARRAAALLAPAGARAFRRGDMPASANLLGRANSLLAAGDPAALDLLPDLGYALFEVGELERAKAALTEAIEGGRARGNRGVEWNAAVKLANARMYTDPDRMDPEELVRDARAAIEVLDELGDELGLARAWCLLSEAEWASGRMVVAATAAERAAHHARGAGSPRDEAWGLGAYSMCLLQGPMPAAEGARKTERLLRQAAGNLVLEANLSGFLAALEALDGRFGAARAHIAESCERLHDLGLRWQAGVQELLAGHIELLAGDPVAAERHMLVAKESFVAIGDRWFLSTVSVDLPRPVYEQGRYADALSLVEAIDEVPAPADREWEVKRWGIRARLLAGDGRIEEAERCARKGVAAAVGTDLLWFHADALIDLAEVLRRADRSREAADAAADALALYEQKGIVASAARARALVEDLRATGVSDT